MEAITRFGDKEIRRRAEADPALADVLERTLSALEVLLTASQRAYRLRAVLTREGEYLIRWRWLTAAAKSETPFGTKLPRPWSRSVPEETWISFAVSTGYDSRAEAAWCNKVNTPGRSWDR